MTLGRRDRKARVASALAAALALLACRPAETAAVAPSPVASVDPGPALKPVAIAPSPDAGVPEIGEPGMVDFAGDGTLLVIGQRVLVARAPSGAVASYVLDKSQTPGSSKEFPGVAVNGPDAVTLLATPTLTVLHTAKAGLLSATPNVLIVTQADPSSQTQSRRLIFQRGQRIVELVIPSQVPEDAGFESLIPVARGKRVNFTYTDANGATAALLYDAETGALLGSGIPLASLGRAPVGAIVGSIGFRIQGSSLERIDLERGAIVRRATIRCPPNQELGNPTPSPTGDLLLVTCGDDGVVLDGVTLARRRSIARVLPGCDNGPILGGLVLPDGHTMHLEGCGGEAKVDLATGKYVCGDSSGLLGAPYEMAPGGGVPRTPRGREGTPTCNQNGAQSSRLGSSGRYLQSYEPTTVKHAGGKIVLEPEVSSPLAIAPDESSFAYARGDRVVLRGLPDGKILAELGLMGH